MGINMKHTLKSLREQAALLGVKIVAIRDDRGWGYWLDGTGWDDENFCTDHDEVYRTLRYLERQRTKKAESQQI